MKPQTYEEACEIVTMYVYDKAAFHNGLHEIQVRNDRIAWLKSYRDMIADDLSPQESIDHLLKRERETDVRERMLAAWINYVNKYEHLPHRDDAADNSSDNSDEPPGSDDETLEFEKLEPSTPWGERIRNRYRDPGTTNTRKDVA
jgi:hypothetical protein